MLEVIFLVNFVALHSFDVNNVDKLRNLVNQNHRSNTSHPFRKCFWQNGQIVSTNWSQIDYESVLVMIATVLLVVRDQLFRIFRCANNLIFNEAHKSLGVRPMFKLKVKSLSVLFASNISTLFLGVVLENQLFQEQESSLVIDLLSDLNLTLPQMRSVSFLTVVTL